MARALTSKASLGRGVRERRRSGQNHSSLGLLTPATVHYGQAAALLEKRQRVLDAAYAAHPERFVKKHPIVQSLPDAVWINRPQPLLEASVESPLGV